MGYYSWLDKSEEIEFTRVEKNHDLLKPYLIYPEVQQLLRTTVGFYVIEPSKDGVYMHDLRFGQLAGWEPDKGDFVFTYRIHIVKEVLISIDQRPNSFEGMDKAFASLFKRIQGNE